VVLAGYPSQELLRGFPGDLGMERRWGEEEGFVGWLTTTVRWSSFCGHVLNEAPSAHIDLCLSGIWPVIH